MNIVLLLFLTVTFRHQAMNMTNIRSLASQEYNNDQYVPNIDLNIVPRVIKIAFDYGNHLLSIF